MMGSYILALKCACLCFCLAVILRMVIAAVKTIRIAHNKLFASNIEAAMMIMYVLFSILVPVCLIWAGAAWIIN